MSSFIRLSVPRAAAALRSYIVSPASGRSLCRPTPAAAISRSPQLFSFARSHLFSFPSAAREAATKPASGILALRLSQPRLGGSLEDYYTHAHLATCIQSPWPFYMWMSWAVLMVIVSIGFLLQSNYYFAGRILPKPSGNTQLCEDSCPSGAYRRFDGAYRTTAAALEALCYSGCCSFVCCVGLPAHCYTEASLFFLLLSCFRLLLSCYSCVCVWMCRCCNVKKFRETKRLQQ